MTTEAIIRLIADGMVLPIVGIAAYVLLFKVPKGRRVYAYSRIILAGLTAFLFAKLIGTVFQPEMLRPFEELGVTPGASFLDNPGFPSDHMLFVTAIVLAVWAETRMKKTTLVLACMALLVGVGRVLALVHTPFDIIGGVLIAILGALWYSNVPRNERREHHHGTGH
jgi:undecaprenyl-diphosphatase